MTTGYESMDMTIDSKEELNDILKKMYCVEDCFEGMNSWIGTVMSDEGARDVLTVLADDSKEHRDKLDDLISRVEWIEAERNQVSEFDLKEGDDKKTILKKVLKNDYDALFHYSLLKNHVDKGFLREVLDEKDVETFFETLEYLIKEELRHISILKSELE